MDSTTQSDNLERIDKSEIKLIFKNLQGDYSTNTQVITPRDSFSSYILNYQRKGIELQEIIPETNSYKSESCVFYISFKILNENSESVLAINCHEIAAIHFDDIYEKNYTYDDLFNENKYFRVFETIQEIKNVIDDLFVNNINNDRKIFIDFRNEIMKIHIISLFFDKDKEIILNIPKIKLSNEDKLKLLPNFLKEIQSKISNLDKENGNLKRKIKNASKNKRKKVNNHTMFSYYNNINKNYVPYTFALQHKINKSDNEIYGGEISGRRPISKKNKEI